MMVSSLNHHVFWSRLTLRTPGKPAALGRTHSLGSYLKQSNNSITKLKLDTLLWRGVGVLGGGSTQHSTAIFFVAILYRYADAKYRSFIIEIVHENFTFLAL